MLNLVKICIRTYWFVFMWGRTVEAVIYGWPQPNLRKYGYEIFSKYFANHVYLFSFIWNQYFLKKKKEFNYFYMLIGFYLIYVNNYHIYKYLKNALHDLHKHD